jgi:hypothetical protein
MDGATAISPLAGWPGPAPGDGGALTAQHSAIDGGTSTQERPGATPGARNENNAAESGAAQTALPRSAPGEGQAAGSGPPTSNPQANTTSNSNVRPRISFTSAGDSDAAPVVDPRLMRKWVETFKSELDEISVNLTEAQTDATLEAGLRALPGVAYTPGLLVLRAGGLLVLKTGTGKSRVDLAFAHCIKVAHNAARLGSSSLPSTPFSLSLSL